MAAFMVPTAGRAWLQDNDLASSTLYVLLIDATNFTAFSDDDTMASHAGWTELTSYSESVRQTWVNTGTSGGSITNTPGAVFTCNDASSAIGWALVTNSTKSGTTGTLIAELVNPTGNAISRTPGQAWWVILEMLYKSMGG